MNTNLRKHDKRYENILYDVLLRIKGHPDLYFLKPSLRELSQLIGGFSIACDEIENYHLSFDQDFQSFIEQKYGEESRRYHWSHLFLQNHTDEDAFSLFFNNFDEFMKKKTEEGEKI